MLRPDTTDVVNVQGQSSKYNCSGNAYTVPLNFTDASPEHNHMLHPDATDAADFNGNAAHAP